MVCLSYFFIGPCYRQLAHRTRNFDSKTYADNNKHTYWQYGIGGVLDFVINSGTTGKLVPLADIAIIVIVVNIAPWQVQLCFLNVISEFILRTKMMVTFSEIARRLISQNTSHDKSTLVLVMAWCCQGTTYYPGHC